MSQATRVQILAGAFGKKIGKNRSVQEGLDMKIVAGLDKMGLFRKHWVLKKSWGKSVCSGRAGYENRS